MSNAATYSTAELAAQARQIFGTTPEVVTVAMRTAEKQKATLDEAKTIVQEFLNREVK